MFTLLTSLNLKSMSQDEIRAERQKGGREEGREEWWLYLEAVFKLLADKVEDDGIYAGVDGGQVDTQVVQHQQETESQIGPRL